jgi:ATP-dependent DNA helicase RecQ
VGKRAPVKDKQNAREVTKIGHRVLPGAQLREEQRESLRELPYRDTLVVLAPAAGKTAIYAIGGELLGGPTVVVSPTVSLQRDQVRALTGSGLTAAVLNSTQPRAHQRSALDRFVQGNLQFLLLAPEQLAKDDVVEQLRKPAPALLVVDEAHCISEWGQDFRPEYLALGAAADAMGRPRVLALTATAALPVRDEIITRLGMHDPHTVVGDTDRPQLHLSVRLLHDEQAKWTR